MRSLYISVKEGNEPLAPQEIAERLKPLFDNLMVDAEAAAEMCKEEIRKYGEYIKKQGGSISILENAWKDAIVVHGWNDDAETEKFRAILRHSDSFILHFYEKLSWPARRRIAKRIGEAIDYEFGLGEEV